MLADTLFSETPVGTLQLQGNESEGLKILRFASTPAAVHPYEANDFLHHVADRLQHYWHGKTDDFSDLALAPQGTTFQQSVWEVLRTIPYGETRSYKWLAEAVGSPNGFRAVGSANGKNPIAIIIPCHRVVNHNGQLGGYAGGLPIKQHLLDLESGVKQISEPCQLALV